MDCRKMREIILTDYTDKKLSGHALTEVEAHLASCTQCRELASGVVSLENTLRSARRISPPPELWERIRAEFSRENSGAALARKFFESIRLLTLRFRPAIVAVACAIIIFAVLAVARLTPQKGSETESLVSMGENGSNADYDFGTPEESFL